MYLSDDFNGYNRNNNSDHNHPVNILVVCNCPLLQRIMTDPQRMFRLPVSLIDVSRYLLPSGNVDGGSCGGGKGGLEWQ